MSCKFVIGAQPELLWAAAAWREAAPGLEIVEVEIGTDEGALDRALGALPAASLAEYSAFVAGGPALLNTARLELMGLVKSRGLAMPPLFCRGALVAATAKVGENSYVGAGAVIGPACVVGYNCVIGAAAMIGSGARVGNSAFIDDGAQLGRGAAIESHATIGLGVIIGHGVKVGKFSIVDKPGCYTRDVAPKTFIHASHAGPMVVVGQ